MSVEPLKATLARVQAGQELLPSLAAAAPLTQDYDQAARAIHRAIPIGWRMWNGSWSSKPKMIEHDIAAYRLRLSRSEVIRLIWRAIRLQEHRQREAKRRHRTAAIAVALCATAGIAAAEPLSGPARVVDGDTLVVAGERIRLAGIDAPEMRQTCTGGDGAVYECGRDARAVMVEIIRGAPVTCRARARDRYGRTVAVCGTEAVPDIGGELVRRGWAVDYRAYDRGCAYCAAENDARGAHRGMWSGRFTMPAEWRKEHRR